MKLGQDAAVLDWHRSDVKIETMDPRILQAYPR